MNVNTLNVTVHGEKAIGIKNEFHTSSTELPGNNSDVATPRQAIEPESYTRTLDIEDIDVQPSQPNFCEDISNREPIYSIGKSKGHILIVNVTFEGEDTERKGSMRDVYRMRTLWENMGFEVSIKYKANETTAENIRSMIRSLASEEIYINNSLIGVIVMSHGNKLNGAEYFKTSDGKRLKTEDVITMLDNKNSAKLRNIPKLFFFQMCRGSERDHGAEEDSALESFDLLNIDEAVEEDAEETSKLPTRSDMMISHATLSGYKSFRIPTDGSWFINAIANVFQKHAHNEDILRLMTRVNDAVSAKIRKSKDPEKDQCKQMSETRFTLRKTLYLFP